MIDHSDANVVCANEIALYIDIDRATRVRGHEKLLKFKRKTLKIAKYQPKSGNSALADLMK